MNQEYYKDAIKSNHMGITPNEYGKEFMLNDAFLDQTMQRNKGKIAKVYMCFPESSEERDKMFTGVLESASKDHLILSDPKTGSWYVLLYPYLKYIVFDEPIN